MDYIHLEIQKSVAVVTIDRPPVNALNSHAYFELSEVFSNLATDCKVRCVILTGAGENAFSAGSDVKEFLPLDSDTGNQYTSKNTQIRESIRTFPNPIICAINGLALGGGALLTQMCDIRVACEEARFGLPEINMGIIGGTQYAVPFISSGIARILIYTGDIINAQEALRVGIFDVVVPRSELRDYCIKMAEKIAYKPPLAIRFAKQALNCAYWCDLAEGLKLEKDLIQKLWGTEDKNEAVSAFLEKRPTQFKGR